MWSVYQITVVWHVKKSLPTERITFTCDGLKQTWQKPQRRKIWSLQKKFITKLTDYLLTIIDLGTASFENESLFNQQKEKFPMIKCFGPMYIDFDEYPRYSGRKSKIFEKC